MISMKEKDKSMKRGDNLNKIEINKDMNYRRNPNKGLLKYKRLLNKMLLEKSKERT